MKLSAAIIVLSSVLADASAGTRRARRRVQDTNNDTITTDFVFADSHNSQDDPSDCKEQEKVTSIVHITAPAAEEGDSPGTGYGGFAFEYNSKLESVEFKGAAGSNFDFSVCMTFKDEDVCDRSIARRLGEGIDVEDNFGAVEGDKNHYDDEDDSDCENKDTILYCPLKKGQCASFQLTDTISYCSDPSVEVASDIKFYVTTPISDASSEEECGGAAILAAQQCGATTVRGFEQTTQCLYGDNIAPLGAQHTFDLQRCAIWVGETPAVITGSDIDVAGRTTASSTALGLCYFTPNTMASACGTTSGTIGGCVTCIEGIDMGPVPCVTELAASLVTPSPDTTSDYTQCLTDNGSFSAPYWYDRDVTGSFVFTDEEASVGTGSLKGEVGAMAAADEKVELEYWSGTDDLYDRLLSDLEYIQFDFFPKTGTCTGCPGTCGSSFYLNIYTRVDDMSTATFFDCDFRYVPDACPEGEWTTFRVDLFSTTVTDTNGDNCPTPATPTGATTNGQNYVLGTSDFGFNNDIGYIFKINVGDTSINDDGLVGYIDNIQVKLKDEANARVYDLEPGSSFGVAP